MPKIDNKIFKLRKIKSAKGLASVGLGVVFLAAAASGGDEASAHIDTDANPADSETSKIDVGKSSKDTEIDSRISQLKKAGFTVVTSNGETFDISSKESYARYSMAQDKVAKGLEETLLKGEKSKTVIVKAPKLKFAPLLDNFNFGSEQVSKTGLDKNVKKTRTIKINSENLSKLKNLNYHSDKISKVKITLTAQNGEIEDRAFKTLEQSSDFKVFKQGNSIVFEGKPTLINKLQGLAGGFEAIQTANAKFIVTDTSSFKVEYQVETKSGNKITETKELKSNKLVETPKLKDEVKTQAEKKTPIVKTEAQKLAEFKASQKTSDVNRSITKKGSITAVRISDEEIKKGKSFFLDEEGKEIIPHKQGLVKGSTLKNSKYDHFLTTTENGNFYHHYRLIDSESQPSIQEAEKLSEKTQENLNKNNSETTSAHIPQGNNNIPTKGPLPSLENNSDIPRHKEVENGLNIEQSKGNGLVQEEKKFLHLQANGLSLTQDEKPTLDERFIKPKTETRKGESVTRDEKSTLSQDRLKISLLTHSPKATEIIKDGQTVDVKIAKTIYKTKEGEILKEVQNEETGSNIIIINNEQFKLISSTKNNQSLVHTYEKFTTNIPSQAPIVDVHSAQIPKITKKGVSVSREEVKDIVFKETIYLTSQGKEISKLTGANPKKDFSGYEFVSTKIQDGKIIHTYKPISKYKSDLDRSNFINKDVLEYGKIIVKKLNKNASDEEVEAARKEVEKKNSENKVIIDKYNEEISKMDEDALKNFNDYKRFISEQFKEYDNQLKLFAQGKIKDKPKPPQIKTFSMPAIPPLYLESIIYKVGEVEVKPQKGTLIEKPKISLPIGEINNQFDSLLKESERKYLAEVETANKNKPAVDLAKELSLINKQIKDEINKKDKKLFAYKISEEVRDVKSASSGEVYNQLSLAKKTLNGITGSGAVSKNLSDPKLSVPITPVVLVEYTEKISSTQPVTNVVNVPPANPQSAGGIVSVTPPQTNITQPPKQPDTSKPEWSGAKVSQLDTIRVKEGEMHGVGFKQLTFDKNGPYKLRLGDAKNIDVRPDNLPNMIHDKDVAAVFNSGFYAVDTLSHDWSKYEIGRGNKAIFAIDGNNNVQYHYYPNLNMDALFSHMGDKGGNFGSFGRIVIDGKKTREAIGDAEIPNTKTARNIFIETKDGKQHIFQNYGHSSIGKGFNLNDLYDYMDKEFGITNIKDAFMMDGGGSTFMVTKDPTTGKISSTGTGMTDGRNQTYIMYLTKNPAHKSQEIWENSSELKPEDKLGVNKERYNKSKALNSPVIIGTDWKIATNPELDKIEAEKKAKIEAERKKLEEQKKLEEKKRLEEQKRKEIEKIAQENKLITERNAAKQQEFQAKDKWFTNLATSKNMIDVKYNKDGSARKEILKDGTTRYVFTDSYNNEDHVVSLPADFRQQVNKANAVKVHIAKQSDLDDYLSKTGYDMSSDDVYFENTEPIIFPKDKTYIINGWTDWYINDKASSNIDFNGSNFLISHDFGLSLRMTGDLNGLAVRNGNFYGSLAVKTDSKGNPTSALGRNSNNGSFGIGMVNTKNVVFDSLNFINTHIMSGHTFDIMGSTNVTIRNSKFKGYSGEHLTKDIITKRENRTGQRNNHPTLSEAIQIDSSYYGGAGIKDEATLKATGYLNTIWQPSDFKGEPSKNILIENNTFTNYKGLMGESIIRDDLNLKVDANKGATIGSHSIGNSGFSNIVIKNNHLKDTIHTYEKGDYDYNGFRGTAPIHMMTGHWNTKNGEYDSDNIRKTTDIKVENNKITNYPHDKIDGKEGRDSKRMYDSWWKSQTNADVGANNKALPYDNQAQLVAMMYHDDGSVWPPGVKIYERVGFGELKQIEHAPMKNFVGRDPNLHYLPNGNYGVALTWYDKDKDFVVYETKDFKTLTPHGIKAGLIGKNVNGKVIDKVWAPEYFEDETGRYYIVSANDKPDHVDDWGGKIVNLSTYIVKMKGDSWEVESTTRVNFDFNSIDAKIFKSKDSKNKYYMLVKDDKTKLNHLYQSNDMKNWTKKIDNVTQNIFKRYVPWVEGVGVREAGKGWEVYLDKYTPGNDLARNQYVAYTEDFVNFTTPTVLTNNLGEPLRHGSILNVKKPTQPKYEELKKIPSF